MKNLIILFLSIFLSISTNNSYAQTVIKTDSFKVQGNCDMCKKRIEEAAFIRGVKHAEWHEQSQELIVVYRNDKTTKESIAKSVAKAGHSSELAQATEKDYNDLPKCCHYKTENCEH